MANKDYGEVLCQAVDTIVSKKLESVRYDETILCQIVDDSKKESGEYVVTNNGGTTKFTAYSSDTSYRKNNNVYVQIPQGDWNQQKLIISKKTDNTDEPYVYKAPFSSLIDITGNLIKATEKTNPYLIANHPTETTIKIWEWENKDKPHKGYTRLGLQGAFQSLLNPFFIDSDNDPHSVAFGEYGLKLTIIGEGEDTVSSGDGAKTVEYTICLDQADMLGNPYNFSSPYLQEKVVDISSVGKITKMTLEFYQVPSSFTDEIGTQIPYQDFLGNLIEPNLKVFDPYISLGYDANEFDREQVQLYSFSSPSFSRKRTEEENKKGVFLRWVHKKEDGTFAAISDQDNMSYEIRWYRYKLGSPSADEYSEVYWENFGKQFVANGVSTFENQNSSEVELFANGLVPDVNEATERIKAVIIYNGSIYKSNILSFNNENEVINSTTLGAVSALSIYCQDDTYGNYRIYRLGNELINQADSSIVRRWVPMFKADPTDPESSAEELTNMESIEWIIPKNNTMVEIDATMTTDADTSKETSEEYHLKYYSTGNDSVVEHSFQEYRIRGYYSQPRSNNTIRCIVVKDGITYSAAKEMTFGPAGTTGTDSTFVIDFENGDCAVPVTGDKEVFVRARLYDYENKEVPLDDYNIQWGWRNINPTIIATGQEKNRKSLQCADSGSLGATYNIIYATLKGWGDYDLTAYLPIPVMKDASTYHCIYGTTQVLYETSGNLSDYFRNPLKLIKRDGEVPESNVTWVCKNANDGEEKFTPTIVTDSTGQSFLRPLNIYIAGANENVCLMASVNEEVVWSQPLLIMQNLYPTAMINKWDGSLKIDEENNIIMAKQGVFGRKDTVTKDGVPQNTFSGVVLGDVSSKDAEQGFVQTGIFGYHQGAQSYAFREDGTAFIGKDGSGRIEFDGNNSIIKSSTYDYGQGMQLNLTDGKIDAHQFALSAGKKKENISNNITAVEDNTIKINTEASDYPLMIGTNFKVKWDGSIKANSGTFDGDITSGSTITGATIKGGSIVVPASGTAKFSVDENGNLTATGATINGTINATAGTLSGLTVNGTLIIGDGGKITGTSGSNTYTLENGKLTAVGADISGAITMGSGSTINWSNVTESNASSSDAYKRADTAYDKAKDAQDTADDAYDKAEGAESTVSGWTYGSTTYIDGAKIMTGTVMASTLQGGEINLLDEYERTAGTMQLANSANSSYAVELNSGSGLRLQAEDGNLYISAANAHGDYWSQRTTFITMQSGGDISFGTDDSDYALSVYPARDDQYELGYSSRRWADIYCSSGTINTSDKKEKKNIEYNMNKYENFFFKLKPTQYKFINGTSDRYHLGFISQDIEEELDESKLTSKDFAGFIKSPNEDNEYIYGLRYSEFIALNTHMIQKLYKENESLKERLSVLEKKEKIQ